RPRGGFGYAWMIVLPSRFEQKNGYVFVFGEASRHDRAGGSRPTNNEVIARSQVRTELLLIRPDSAFKFPVHVDHLIVQTRRAAPSPRYAAQMMAIRSSFMTVSIRFSSGYRCDEHMRSADLAARL